MLQDKIQEVLFEDHHHENYAIYLLHFHKPFKHARHYIGMVHGPDNLDRRIDDHRRGRGANLVRVVRQAGIDFDVARTWMGVPRSHERRLKNRGGAARICPICRGEA